MRLGFSPTPALLIRNPDGLIGNHFAGSADGTIYRPHGSRADGFGDELDFEAGVATWAEAFR